MLAGGASITSLTWIWRVSAALLIAAGVCCAKRFEHGAVLCISRGISHQLSLPRGWPVEVM